MVDTLACDVIEIVGNDAGTRVAVVQGLVCNIDGLDFVTLVPTNVTVLVMNEVKEIPTQR